MPHQAPETKRPLPNAGEIENHLVGLVFQDPSIFAELMGIVRPADFYDFRNSLAWEAFCDLRASGKPITPAMAHAWLMQGRIAEFGGQEGFLEFFCERRDHAVGRKDAADYARVVKQTKVARDLIEFAEEVQKKAYQVVHDATDVLADTQKSLAKLGMSASTSAVQTHRDVVTEFFTELDERMRAHEEGRDSSRCMETGIYALDNIIGGMFRSELSIIAARPSVGKTVFGGILARNFGRRKIPGLFISLEQRSTAIVGRILAGMANVPGTAMRKGDLSEWQKTKISANVDALGSLPIWWDQTSTQSMAQISSTARNLKAKYDIRYCIIDYLTLVTPETQKGRSRNDEVGEISRQMKALARELDIAVISLAQLNRGLENRADPTPKISDLRDSGEIEANADVILLLHKPDAADVHRMEDRLEIHVGKCREGGKGKIDLIHHKPYFDFRAVGEVVDDG